MHGKFFWFDLMTTDTAAAAKFYSQVVGWGVQDAGAPGPPDAPGSDYTLFTVGDRGVAGLMPVPAEMQGQARPCWMSYIAADDVDQTVAKLQELGGVLHRGPIDVPGVIRFAVVSDPQGAGFLVARGLVEDAPPDLPPRTPGTAGWHELYAEDGASALAFYEALFGWTKTEAFDLGEMGSYQTFATGGPPAGGVMTRPPQIPAPYWGVYIVVEALGAAIERVTAAGGTILMGPHQVPGGEWIVQGLDPQGATFALLSDKE